MSYGKNLFIAFDQLANALLGAKKYGVSKGIVTGIKTKRNWKEIHENTGA